MTNKDNSSKSTYCQKMSCMKIIRDSIGQIDSFSMECARADPGEDKDALDESEGSRIILDALEIDDEEYAPVDDQRRKVPRQASVEIIEDQGTTSSLEHEIGDSRTEVISVEAVALDAPKEENTPEVDEDVEAVLARPNNSDERESSAPLRILDTETDNTIAACITAIPEVLGDTSGRKDDNHIANDDKISTPTHPESIRRSSRPKSAVVKYDSTASSNRIARSRTGDQASSEATPKSSRISAQASVNGHEYQKRSSESIGKEGLASPTPYETKNITRVEGLVVANIPPRTPRHAMHSRRLKMVVILQTTLSEADYQMAKRVVDKLGGRITDDCEEATVFVGDRIRISLSVMCALGKRIPLVTMKWIVDSEMRNDFATPRDYVLNDLQGEEKFNIDVQRILTLDLPFLQDWKVACSYSEKAPSSLVGQNHFIPGPEEIAKLTRCCGGTFSELESLRVTKTKNYNLLVVRCLKHQTDDEKRTIADVKKRGINFMDVSTFFVCCGRQSKKAFQSSLNKCR